MELKYQCIENWAKLAWVAIFPKGSSEIQILHGPCVEARGGWCVEAVWAGDFNAGDFDSTDLIFGTGVRCREDKVFFVSSGTTFEQIWHCLYEDVYYVSNSLPAILAVSKLRLCDDYPDYSRDLYAIAKGLAGAKFSIPAVDATINITYFKNLSYDGTDIKEIDKSEGTLDFSTFEQYYDFLKDTAKKIGENSTDKSRSFTIQQVSTISTGYDSSVSAVISQYAGCRQAVTITNASSLWPGNDSGKQIADFLGMSCRSYRHNTKYYKEEESFWAATGNPADLNMSLFDFPKPLCLVFTGYQGDNIWGKDMTNMSDPFSGGGFSGRGICEFRLKEGFFHCVVPFWGLRRLNEIRAITNSKTMKQWTLLNDYDRPIPRRIVEDAGVPRTAFGMKKRNTQSIFYFYWPISRASGKSFKAFLEQRGIDFPIHMIHMMAPLIRKIARLEFLFYFNVLKRFGVNKRYHPWDKVQTRELIFQWANHELIKKYEAALED